MIKLGLFAFFSIGLAGFYWRFLRLGRTHGFYRFFSLRVHTGVNTAECGPLVSKPVLRGAGGRLAIANRLRRAGSHSAHLLVKVGKPTRTDGREEEIAIEATTTLVIVGAYRYISHPLYASLLCLGWGAFVKHVTWLGFLLVVALSAFLAATAKVEEAENLRKFGDSYTAYMKTTKMFVPFLV